MFLPIGDTPNPRNWLAWTNWALMAANVAIFVFVTLPLSSRPPDLNDPLVWEYLRALGSDLPHGMSPMAALSQLTAYDLFIFEHGYKPGAPEVGDLFYSMFLHGGLLHLAGNMLFLWIYGDNVEHRLGRVAYLVTYLGTGAAATLTYALFAGNSHVPLVGASGAISGVLGLYFLMFPHNRVKVFVFLFPLLMDVVLLPARLVLALYVIIDNLLPIVLGAESGVAYGAHLGGFVTGLALAALGAAIHWRLPWKGRALAGVGAAGTVPIEDDLDESEPRPKRPPADRLVAAIDRGERWDALSQIGRVEGRELYGLDLSRLSTLALWMAEEGYPEEAETLLHRALGQRGRVVPRELARVQYVLGLIQLRLGQTAAGYQLLRRALSLDPDPDTQTAIEEALLTVPTHRRRA